MDATDRSQGPAECTNDIIGTAFLIRYQEKEFIISASHVVKQDNLFLMFSIKDSRREKDRDS
jgi:hypothetical protein